MMVCMLMSAGRRQGSSPYWGFYGHRQINYLSVFLLPPGMLVFFKPNINYLSEHAVDPDKRRYLLADEGPRHYIDLDRYGAYPFSELPRKWQDAVSRFSEDSLKKHGIVPWHVLAMQARLTKAFREKDAARILKYAADIGHYIADAHVPLHTSSNHNGQYTDQKGIHGFWESRIPELLAEQSFDLLNGHAQYIEDPGSFIWGRVLESAIAVDSVLSIEKSLSKRYPPDQRYAFENRNGLLVKQYSSAYTMAYHDLLNGMVERRMRQAIFSVASFWYTAWVDAGQPRLDGLGTGLQPEDSSELKALNDAWRSGGLMLGRPED